jgi:hypothetical protein
MRVELVRTEGYGREALIEVDGVPLRVVDAVSEPGEPAPPGPVDDPVFTAVVVAPASWSRAVAENRDRAKRVEPIHGWRHRGFGEIRSLSPLRADLGVLQLELALPSDPARCVGDFVALDIDRIRLARRRSP